MNSLDTNSVAICCCSFVAAPQLLLNTQKRGIVKWLLKQNVDVKAVMLMSPCSEFCWFGQRREGQKIEHNTFKEKTKGEEEKGKAMQSVFSTCVTSLQEVLHHHHHLPRGMEVHLDTQLDNEMRKLTLAAAAEDSPSPPTQNSARPLAFLQRSARTDTPMVASASDSSAVFISSTSSTRPS